MLDFPANPTIGQVFTSGGVTWIWDGTKWVASGVAGQPPLATGDNRIINGDMRIDQRNNGASGTAIGYTVDRWKYGANQTGKGTWQRYTGGAMAAFPYYLLFISSSAYTALAGDSFQFAQIIEADMISDFAWGTAGAQPVTLSFWVTSNLTGTFSGSITNTVGTRSYPFTFSVVAGWQKIVITIPGDTSGPWALNGNTAGLSVDFDLGSGANFRGPANAWASANYTGATGTVSVVGTNGAQFYVTGVKLEIGSVATPFNRQSLAKSMVDCQRYFVQPNIGFQVQGTMNAGYGAQFQWSAPVTMRATPTIVASISIPSNCTLNNFSMLDARTLNGSLNVTATGQFYASMNVTALSAEL